jgi:hypothetical protein
MTARIAANECLSSWRRHDSGGGQIGPGAIRIGGAVLRLVDLLIKRGDLGQAIDVLRHPHTPVRHKRCPCAALDTLTP